MRDEQNGLDKDILDTEEERPLSQDLPENSTASECAVSALSYSHEPSVPVLMPKVTHIQLRIISRAFFLCSFILLFFEYALSTILGII